MTLRMYVFATALLLLCFGQARAQQATESTWHDLQWWMTRQEIISRIPQAHDYSLSLPYEVTLRLFGTNTWTEDSYQSTLNFFFTSRGGLEAISLALIHNSAADMRTCAAHWLTDLDRRYGSPIYASQRTFPNGRMLAVVKVWRTHACDVLLNQTLILASGPMTSFEFTYRTPGFFAVPLATHPVK